MIYINITKFVLNNQLEEDHSMIQTRRLKNVAIFNFCVVDKNMIPVLIVTIDYHCLGTIFTLKSILMTYLIHIVNIL